MWSLSKGQPQPKALYLLRISCGQKNTLTQRCIGPKVSTATVTLDVSQLKNGDIAGLGILNIPYLYIGINVKEQNISWKCVRSNRTKTYVFRLKKKRLPAYHNRSDNDTRPSGFQP